MADFVLSHRLRSVGPVNESFRSAAHTVRARNYVSPLVDDSRLVALPDNVQRLDRSIPFRVCGSPILAPEILEGQLWEPRNQRRYLVVMSDSYFSGYFTCRMPLGSSKEPLRALFWLPWVLEHGTCFDATWL